MSVVSYEERRKRKHVADDENQEEKLQPKESGSARRKRLRLELKEKRRAYNSYPHTPISTSGGTGKTGPKNRRNISEPVSPADSNLNLSVFDVTRYNLVDKTIKLMFPAFKTVHQTLTYFFIPGI